MAPTSACAAGCSVESFVYGDPPLDRHIHTSRYAQSQLALDCGVCGFGHQLHVRGSLASPSAGALDGVLRLTEGR